MLALVFRKLFSNSWKVLCLLLGSILVVGMVCSIPIYTNGILQRLLTKDLENAQLNNKRYPGYMALISNYNYVGKEQAAATMVAMRVKSAEMIANMPIEPELTLETLQISNLYYMYENKKGTLSRQSYGIDSTTDFASHVTVVKGRMYDPARSDGIIEAVVSADALKSLNMLLDKDYEVYSYRQKKGEPSLFSIRIVGLIEPADNQDLYWYQSINALSQSLLVDQAVLEKMAITYPSILVSNQQIVAAYDYHQFRIQEVSQLEAVHEIGKEAAEVNVRTTKLISTFQDVIESYIIREAELKLTLQILIVPILLMLIFYIFMVSQLMIRSETGIISVLESRGAGRTQILTMYAIESMILGAITLIIGPFLGLWMVKVIGAANGFLEFVNRKALKTELDSQAIWYGILAVCLFLITTLLPVFMQARTSIVQQKLRKSRVAKAPFWQRIFLDLVLLAISIYALYRLREQLAIQQTTGASGIEMNLDFLLFISSTIFIMGAGLFFLRIYPLLLRFIYFIGRRFWNPVLYASFHQISRSNGQEQFLMLFLILALSIGLFNANAARTINRNTEDSIRCEVGADIQVQEYWQKYDKNGVPINEQGGMTMGPAPSSPGDDIVKYNEPNFEKYSRLEGIESASRVYRSDKTRISKGSARSTNIQLMAIDPYDFANTVWSRQDLFRYHMNEYMNVMISLPNAVILSSNLKEELGLEIGDGIIYTVNGTDSVDGVVIAFVEFWPGFQPITLNTSDMAIRQALIVSSLDFVLSKSAIQPYQVWLKRAEGYDDKSIYEAIEKAKINVTNIESATQNITAAKNDPQLQGTNGALTLGFIVSMLICAVGFLIYWIMSVQGRVLQFGIFRAMGLSKGDVLGMLIAEQGLVSGVAILIGIIVGMLSSILFVPLFQLVYSSVEQPIPFRVISEAADANKVYIVLAALLLICFAVLTRLILSIRIDQAVKLGED